MDAFAFSNVREKREQSAVALSVVVVGVGVEVEVGQVVVVKISKADGGKEDKISLACFSLPAGANSLLLEADE